MLRFLSVGMHGIPMTDEVLDLEKNLTRSEAVATRFTPSAQYFTSIFCFHTRAKPCCRLPALLARLVSTFHRPNILLLVLSEARG